jgi:hypothetical protein
VTVAPHREFYSLDFADSAWERPEGYPPGFHQIILASNLDEVGKIGRRSRLMKIEPGAYSRQAFVHDHWEEVFLFRGDLVVGCDAHGQDGELFRAPTFAIRPPGVYHGPFTTRGGCLLFELHYYAPRA